MLGVSQSEAGKVQLRDTEAVRLADGTVRRAELHWFEAHGIGKRKMRVKRFLD